DSVRLYGTRPGATAEDGRGNLLEIRCRKLDRRGPDPAIHLRRCPGTHDRSRDARPRECPGDGDGRYRRPVALGDWFERVAERDIPREVRLPELHAAAAPIIGRERGDSGGAEALGEDPRLHRTVGDDAVAVLGGPRDLPLRDVATDEREGRLQRVDVPDRLAACQ